MIKVKNLRSPRSNSPVANQFTITTPTGRIFQSYDTIIAKYEGNQLILDTNALNYSRTTSKYLYQFTNSNRSALLFDIKNGLVLVRDLNN